MDCFKCSCRRVIQQCEAQNLGKVPGGDFMDIVVVLVMGKLESAATRWHSTTHLQTTIQESNPNLPRE